MSYWTKSNAVKSKSVCYWKKYQNWAPVIYYSGNIKVVTLLNAYTIYHTKCWLTNSIMIGKHFSNIHVHTSSRTVSLQFVSTEWHIVSIYNNNLFSARNYKDTIMFYYNKINFNVSLFTTIISVDALVLFWGEVIMTSGK